MVHRVEARCEGWSAWPKPNLQATMPAYVSLRRGSLAYYYATSEGWCSRQDLHLYCRRSRRRASALGYASEWMEPPVGVAPTSFLYKRNPQAAAERQSGGHANASQSPVLPRAWLAYDACLNAGSTAVLAHGHHFNGREIGLPSRSRHVWARMARLRFAMARQRSPSTDVGGEGWSPHPELHRADSLTERVHR